MNKASVNSANCHIKLSREEIIDATAKFARSFGLMGSAGPLNMYELMLAYLLDLDKRARLNMVIGWDSPLT